MTNHQPDGQVQVTYASGYSELVSLKSTRWCLTRKGERHYLPPTIIPPKKPLKTLWQEVNRTKFHYPISHALKALVDNLTVLSQNLVNHYKATAEVESVFMDLDM